jgi:hypothetical protein
MMWMIRRRLLVPLSATAIALAVVASACGGSESGVSTEAEAPDGAADPAVSEAVRAEPAGDAPSTPSTVDAAPPEPVTVSGAPVPPPVVTSASAGTERVGVGGNFPPLTDPRVVLAADAVWLEDATLVLGAVRNGDARAYPVFMMTYHHVANDVLGGLPYLVTY